MGFRWRIIGFYGNPEAYRRKESWEELGALSKKFKLPWLCYGDYNEILFGGGEDEGGGSMLVVLKIWGIAVLISCGVICKKGKTAYI